MRLIALLILVSFRLGSQTISNTKFGSTIGVVIDLGTHVRSFGVVAKAYYTDYFYQLNISSSITFNALSYGRRKNFIENRSALGLVLLGGKKNSRIDFVLDGLNHNTAYNYGVGFNYLWYYDNIGTSQVSGGWSAHLKNTSLYFENDVFGGQARDRFRTGYLVGSYKLDDFKVQIGSYIWTGETRGSRWVKLPMPKMPNGYRSLEDLPYGRTSHGTVFLGLQSRLPFGQVAHLRYGLDSENVRNWFQNRLVHDLVLLPQKIERNTPHYPRLDEYGCPVFVDEEIRKTGFFMQFGLNDGF